MNLGGWDGETGWFPRTSPRASPAAWLWRAMCAGWSGCVVWRPGHVAGSGTLPGQAAAVQCQSMLQQAAPPVPGECSGLAPGA